MVPLPFLIQTARAHQPGLSSLRIGDREVTLSFSRTELGERYPMDDLDAVSVLLEESFTAHLTLTVDGTPCEVGPARAEAQTNDGVALISPMTCPPGQQWTVDAPYLSNLQPGHRHVVEAWGSSVAMLGVDDTHAAFTVATPSTGAVVQQFVVLGVEHILTGFDHLAFLLGLLLVARSLRQMLGVVTGFTVAHSITLSLAALGVVGLPPRLVEAGIAASILYVGIENFWDPGPRRRFLVTFALGLIHGFGFAWMLVQIGLPRGNTAVALVCFNVGVELGQAALVLGALPLLLRLREREAWRDRAVPVLSAAIALLGAAWLVQRLFLTP